LPGKPQYPFDWRRTVLSIVILIVFFGCLDLWIYSQPGLKRVQRGDSVERTIDQNGTQLLLSENLENFGKTSIGVEITARGTALSQKLVDKPYIVLAVRSIEGQNKEEKISLHPQADGS
jgi:hypothetical protein